MTDKNTTDINGELNTFVIQQLTSTIPLYEAAMNGQQEKPTDGLCKWQMGNSTESGTHLTSKDEHGYDKE